MLQKNSSSVPAALFKLPFVIFVHPLHHHVSHKSHIIHSLAFQTPPHLSHGKSSSFFLLTLPALCPSPFRHDIAILLVHLDAPGSLSVLNIFRLISFFGFLCIYFLFDGFAMSFFFLWQIYVFNFLSLNFQIYPTIFDNDVLTYVLTCNVIRNS